MYQELYMCANLGIVKVSCNISRLIKTRIKNNFYYLAYSNCRAVFFYLVIITCGNYSFAIKHFVSIILQIQRERLLQKEEQITLLNYYVPSSYHALFTSTLNCTPLALFSRSLGLFLKQRRGFVCVRQLGKCSNLCQNFKFICSFTQFMIPFLLFKYIFLKPYFYRLFTRLVIS